MPKIKTVDHLASIKSYEGVKPLEIIAEELNIPVAKLIKLDGNENPYDPLPEVIATLSSLKNISYYPDTLSSNLIQVLAKKENLEADNFIASSGSDELIELLIKAYANLSDTVLSVSPTFGMISFLAQVHGIKHVAVSQQLVKEESFAHYVLNEDQFFDEAKQSKIVYIARPNNPDGNVVSEKFIERLASLPVLIVIDEAYIEFSVFQSLAKWVSKYDNFVVLRTFSKAYGLGGLRVGYGIMSNDIRKVLISIKQPYNVNIAGQKAAISALSSPLVDQRITEMKKIREWFISQLCLLQNQFKNFWIHPSEACYVLLTFESPEIPKDLYEYLYSKGILVRYYSSSDMINNLRISIGLQENMVKVIDEIKLFLKGGN
ncbi:MAG: aminotransferase class I/II-fold pyridoxal phosphate-dependent enzyme [Candidatus Lokiarchaeota archaeon]|nr:aminotransferase class I/II-fold pyridoxal phosphate-dependent enzyme [Candidatus Lokiarchaeota archaeon]